MVENSGGFTLAVGINVVTSLVDGFFFGEDSRHMRLFARTKRAGCPTTYSLLLLN